MKIKLRKHFTNIIYCKTKLKYNEDNINKLKEANRIDKQSEGIAFYFKNPKTVLSYNYIDNCKTLNDIFNKLY